MDQCQENENQQFDKQISEIQILDEIKNEIDGQEDLENLFSYCSDYQLFEQEAEIIENEISIKSEYSYIVKKIEEPISQSAQEKSQQDDTKELSFQILKMKSTEFKQSEQKPQQIMIIDKESNQLNEKEVLNTQNQNKDQIQIQQIQDLNHQKNQQVQENNKENGKPQNQEILSQEKKQNRILIDQESEEIPSQKDLNKRKKKDNNQSILSNEESEETPSSKNIQTISEYDKQQSNKDKNQQKKNDQNNIISSQNQQCPLSQQVLDQLVQSRLHKKRQNQEESELISNINENSKTQLESIKQEEIKQKHKRKSFIIDEVIQDESVFITKCKFKKRPKIITQITIESEGEIKKEHTEQDIKYKKVKVSRNIGPMVYKLQDKENKNKYGRFLKDQPDIIISHKINSNKYKNLDVLPDLSTFNIKYFMYKVTWKRRDSGRIPMPSYYEYEEIKRVIPRLLLDYLEQLSEMKL